MPDRVRLTQKTNRNAGLLIMKKKIPFDPLAKARQEDESPQPMRVDELVQAIVKANRDKRHAVGDKRQRGKAKVQSVVDRILSGRD